MHIVWRSLIRAAVWRGCTDFWNNSHFKIKDNDLGLTLPKIYFKPCLVGSWATRLKHIHQIQKKTWQRSNKEPAMQFWFLDSLDIASPVIFSPSPSAKTLSFDPPLRLETNPATRLLSVSGPLPRVWLKTTSITTPRCFWWSAATISRNSSQLVENGDDCSIDSIVAWRYYMYYWLSLWL